MSANCILILCVVVATTNELHELAANMNTRMRIHRFQEFISLRTCKLVYEFAVRLAEKRGEL